MKNPYIIKILGAVLICAASAVQASEKSAEELSKRSKRAHSEIASSSSLSEVMKEPDAKKVVSSSVSSRDSLTESNSQVYSIPTYDATFKYMLSDPEICLSFLKAFTLKSDIKSIEKLDEHLRPIQACQNAQSLTNDQKSKDFMKRISNLSKKKKEVDVVYAGSKKQNSIANGSWFISELTKIYGDILSSFPASERNSTVDVLCRLDNDAYALVEVQVVEQDYWDQRALAYASSVYSRQMKQSDKWDKLQEVICINILGGGLKSIQWDSVVGFKHYVLKDQHNAPMNGGIEILQYPLYYSATLRQASAEAANDVQRLALKEWMDFLEHASLKKETDVTQVKTEGLQKAYERVKAKNLPQEVKEANEKQDEEVFKRSARIIEQKEKKARAEGKAEGIAEGERIGLEKTARNMLVKGISVEQVGELTGLSMEIIKSLQS